MHLFPAQLLSQNLLPRRICGVGYENALGNVQPDCRNLTMDGLFAMDESSPAFGTD